jgi:hypothetical protein
MKAKFEDELHEAVCKLRRTVIYTKATTFAGVGPVTEKTAVDG